MQEKYFEKIADTEGIEDKEEISKEARAEKSGEYFQYLRPLGEVFSQYGVYGLEVDPKAERFYFNHETKKVVVSPKLIERLGLEQSEKKWAFLHEFGHLIQLFQDPEAYLESFEIPKKKAEKSGDKNDEKHYRHFFNAFLDIHDNSIVRRQMPGYQRGRWRRKNPPSTL